MSAHDEILAWCRTTPAMVMRNGGKRTKYEGLKLVADGCWAPPLYVGNTWEDVHQAMVEAGKLSGDAP